jgi:glycosyltransferase involved in cell wall biosynthesis
VEEILILGPMRIVIVADSFPPLKNSAAVLVFSLAEVMASEGHDVLVITPSEDLETSSLEDDFGTFKVLRIHCGKIKSHYKFMRGISELSLFFSLPHHFRKTVHGKSEWDMVIWYSPTIFLGGLVKELKRRAKFSYLILRDIVPDWMVDIGLMKKGPIYFLLKWFEHFQYRLADVIGVQSPGNKKYIEKLDLSNLKKIEVLPNWMPSTSTTHHFKDDGYSYTNLKHTLLAGRKIFIYAGNLGEAQGIENFSQVMLNLKDQSDCGFLIIGRGSKKEWLHHFIESHDLKNVLLLDEVDILTLSMYYRQCHGGLVFLDPNHQSHNIPGKFISYLEAGLPVAAYVNPGNDLIKIITDEMLGIVAGTPVEFSANLISLISTINDNVAYGARSRIYYENHYRPSSISRQILASVSGDVNLTNCQ